MYSATVTAPVNIAYWGKRDVKLNLPTNNSISVTLSQDDLKATTTASASTEFAEDQLILNGAEEPFTSRLQAVFSELRSERAKLEKKLERGEQQQVVKLSQMKLHIVSENNFPTAAGLASSAAGFAALVKAIATLFELPHTDEELSVYARQGSGSACRSLMGGYVAWEMGSRADGLDSKAVQIAPASHWPDMRAIILVVSDKKKETSSTAGMQQTVATSTLFQHRIKDVVPQRYEQMKNAILAKDFPTFAQLTMADSNQFHAVCLDTYPPIFYMTDVSRAAVRAVEAINAHAGKTIAAYTFDAGPNAVIYHLAEHEHIVLGALKAAVPQVEGWEKKKGADDIKALDLTTFADSRWAASLEKGISRVILTKVDKGPQKL